VKRALFACSLVAAAAAPAAADEVDAPQRITLEEAVDAATTGNFQVALGNEQVRGAESRVRKTKTYRLPSLGIKANVFLWDSEIPLEVAGMQLGVIREQVTGSAEVSIVQPITTAIVLGKLIKLEEAGVTASRAELDVTKLDLGYQAAEAYLGALQLGTLREIAATSVAQLEANLELVRKLRAADVLSDLDVLRLEASRDQAIQQALEAESGAETAERGLALLLGLPDGTDLELVELEDATPELGWTEDEAVELAQRQRPEARVAAAHSTQADLGIEVARAAYLPSVVAIASYTHAFNAGQLGSADSAFVGLSLEWNLWDWGSRKEDIAQARSASRQASLYEGFVDDQLSFDVRAKWLKASTARKTLDVSKTGLKASEEAYRLQQVRFTQGAVTATEVIDAEAEVARGRSQATIARYQYLIAWMAVVRAVGDMPHLAP